MPKDAVNTVENRLEDEEKEEGEDDDVCMISNILYINNGINNNNELIDQVGYDQLLGKTEFSSLAEDFG